MPGTLNAKICLCFVTKLRSVSFKKSCFSYFVLEIKVAVKSHSETILTFVRNFIKLYLEPIHLSVAMSGICRSNVIIKFSARKEAQNQHEKNYS